MNIKTFRLKLEESLGVPITTILGDNHPFIPSNRVMTPLSGVTPKESSVVILTWEEAGEVYILFTQRSLQLRHHPGQISFPGGKMDKTDISLMDTAIREVKEEVGVDIPKSSIVRSLTPFYISVSNFNITPYIAILDKRPTLLAATDEVERLLYTPLSKLANSSFKKIKLDIDKTTVEAKAYSIDEDRVWGATAIIVHELLSITYDEYSKRF